MYSSFKQVSGAITLAAAACDARLTTQAKERWNIEQNMQVRLVVEPATRFLFHLRAAAALHVLLRDARRSDAAAAGAAPPSALRFVLVISVRSGAAVVLGHRFRRLQVLWCSCFLCRGSWEQTPCAHPLPLFLSMKDMAPRIAMAMGTLLQVPLLPL